MKKVLIITEAFPPEALVGGLRAAMFSKYLNSYGWDTYILTSKNKSKERSKYDIKGLPGKNKIFRAAYEKKHKNICETITKKILYFYAPEKTNPPRGYFAFKKIANKIIHKIQPDVILGTAPTLFPLKISSELSQQYSIPFIADMRDIIEETFSSNWAYYKRLQYLRLKFRRNHILKTACRIITVSKELALILHTNCKKKIDIIPNGYDEQMFNKTNKKLKKKNKLTITYTGRLLDETLRDPNIFFKAVHQLINTGKLNKDSLNINFYGTEKEKLLPYINKYKLHCCVFLFDRVNYSEIPEILLTSDVLLLITNFGRKGILTTKFFEYLASERFILCVPNDGDELEEKIIASNTGKAVSTVKEAKSCILELYKEWERTGSIRVSPNVNYIEQFSRKRLTKKLSKILNDVIEKK